MDVPDELMNVHALYRQAVTTFKVLLGLLQNFLNKIPVTQYPFIAFDALRRTSLHL